LLFLGIRWSRHASDFIAGLLQAVNRCASHEVKCVPVAIGRLHGDDVRGGTDMHDDPSTAPATSSAAKAAEEMKATNIRPRTKLGYLPMISPFAVPKVF
jgi:hypothetical protein